MSSHSNQTIDLEAIKSKFNKYKGGCLKLEKNDDSGIALMCLSSPGRRNSFSGEMMVQMSELLTELEKWQKVVHLFTQTT
jgi:enoyl-coA hydratase, putative